MESEPLIINCHTDKEWLLKAKRAIDELKPFRLTGDEQQILEVLNYKQDKAGEWKTEGSLSIEPCAEI